jgi:hypothetical protein
LAAPGARDKIALGKLPLVSGLSPEFLSVFDENAIDGIIQCFVAMSDWPLIEQNIRVDLAVDVREQAPKIKAPTLSIAGKYDQIVPTFYTQELADLILTAQRAEIPSGHLSFLEKPVDLASAMLTFLFETVRNANSCKVEASGASHAVHMSRAKEVAALIEEVESQTNRKTLRTVRAPIHQKKIAVHGLLRC